MAYTVAMMSVNHLLIYLTRALGVVFVATSVNSVVAQESTTGQSVYEYWCATCHSPGPLMPGTQALEVKYDGSIPAVLTEREDLTAEFISAIVRSGISVMPPFRKTEISDPELEALSNYIVASARAN